MPTQIFPSFEAHAAALHNSNVRTILVGSATAAWTMSSLVMPKFKAQWGQAGAANIVEGSAIPNGISIFMPTHNAAAVKLNGHQLDAQTLRIQIPGDEFCISSAASHSWFSVFIPNEMLAKWNSEEGTTIGSSSGFIKLSKSQAESFVRSVVQLGLIVGSDVTSSQVGVDTTTSKLEKLMRETLCSNAVDGSRFERRSISRNKIVRSAISFVDRHEDDHPSLPKLANWAGVSERTLRTAFREYLGAAPAQYLKLKRLSQVHRALEAADSSMTTVTQIAFEHGIWELGRFAREYSRLYGELPSVTLSNSCETSYEPEGSKNFRAAPCTGSAALGL